MALVPPDAAELKKRADKLISRIERLCEETEIGCVGVLLDPLRTKAKNGNYIRKCPWSGSSLLELDLESIEMDICITLTNNSDVSSMPPKLRQDVQFVRKKQDEEMTALRAKELSQSLQV